MHKEDKHQSSHLEQNFFAAKTKFEMIEEKIKKTIFGVLNILLKFTEGSFISEILSLINETCQFLYYPFYGPMEYLWKKPDLFAMVSKCLSYFQTVVFFNNVQLYIVVFYVMLFMVVLVVVDIIYVSIAMASKNKAAAVWPMRLLRSVVSFIVTVMFMPLVEFFIAILECSNKDSNGDLLGYYQNYNIDGLHCWETTHFTVMCVLAIMIVIIFVIICAIVQTIFYETKTSEKIEGTKTNSKADLTSLYVKIVLIICYSFLVYDQKLHWFVVPATFLAGFMQFYVYWTERPFYEEKMNTAFFIHTGIFFWSTIILLLCKFLEKSSFDGGIIIFFVGTPIIVVIILVQPDHRFKLLLTNINKFEKGDSIVKQIRYFLELADTKFKNRKSKIILKGYITVHEEYCMLSDCPLKKYLKEIEKSEKGSTNVNVNGTQTGYGSDIPIQMHSTGPVLTSGAGGTTLLNNTTSFGNVHTEADLYLYQHAMIMYQNGISKFPNCTKLRMNYAFFLIERMNNVKKSLIELKNCEQFEPTFEEEFIIFRFVQNQAGGESKEDDNEEEEGLDIVSNIAYKNHYNLFKEALTIITGIYIDFWSLLLNHSQKSEEDLTKMNEYGEKINQLIEAIKMNYDEMEKLKYNDEEVLKLYSDFFMDILNDKPQAEYYKKRLQDLQGNATSTGNNEDKGESNVLQGLPITDEFEYIFLAGEGENIGLIIKISFGICSMFGYTPIDVVGKHIDFLMPDMFQEAHKTVLYNRINKFKTQLNQNYRNNIKSSQKICFREIFTFGKNKLKHAIPLSMKVTLMTTQDKNEMIFASRILNEDLYNEINAKNPIPGVPPIINFNMKICYVLTDVDFIVQFYTANAIHFLGFKSNTVGNADITKSINDLNNNEDKPELSKMTKTDLFKKRYFDQKKIIWRTMLSAEEDPIFHLESTTNKFNMKGLMNYSKNIQIHSMASPSPMKLTKTLTDIGNEKKKKMQFLPLKRQRYKEDSFLMSLTEMNIMNQAVGFVFRFEVVDAEDNDLDPYENKNFFPTHTLSQKNSLSVNLQTEFYAGYIPEVNNRFDLDTHNLVYTLKNITNKEEEKETDWHMKIKDYANEKLNRYKEALSAYKENEEEEEDEDEEEEDESDYENDSDQESISYTVSNEPSSLADNTQQLPIPVPFIPSPNMSKRGSIKQGLGRRSTVAGCDQYEFNYFHVKISNIKFSIYDYKKRRLVDVPQIKRESQVEYKKKEQLPDFGLSKKKKRPREIIADQDDPNNEEEDNGIDVNLVKQIEYALHKEENQPEIIKLRWISFITYTLLIIIASLLLMLLLSNITIVKEHIAMISDHHHLISNIIEGIYYMRELVLLNNHKYTHTLFDKQISITNATGNLNELFTDSYKLQKSILTTATQMSNGRVNLFINGTTLAMVLEKHQKTLAIRQVNMTINTAMGQMLTSMYQVANMDIVDIIPIDSSIFFYMRNGYKPMMRCLVLNMNNFIDELRDNITLFKSKHLLTIIIMIIGLVISTIAINIMYNKAVQLKSSYLEVFFEINDNVSKRALDKCELFAEILHPLSANDLESQDDDDDILLNANPKKSNTPKNDQVVTPEKVNVDGKKKKRKKEPNRNYIFFLEVIVIYIIAIGYLVSVVITFQIALDEMLDYSSLYNITAFHKHNNLVIFDILRDYAFDPKSFIGISPIDNAMEFVLSDVYIAEERVVEMFNPDKLPSSFKEMYRSINKDSICNYTRNLFTENHQSLQGKTCESLSSNSSNYGMNVLLSFYIENLRTLKYSFDYLNNEANKKYDGLYNNTLYTLNDTNQDEEYQRLDPFQIFNDDLMFRLNVIRKYYIEPAYDVLVNTFYEDITLFWSGKHSLYIALLVILLIGMTLFYILIWMPIEKKLDRDIYKTKNMLSIIPKDVLASLKNINNILKLGASYIQPQTQPQMQTQFQVNSQLKK